MPARALHTADVHLHGERPARRDALEAVLSLAAERDVDVVTIGGDLFDRPDDVESLVPGAVSRIDTVSRQ
jgi:DNA repair exonuclease SbcCD nuclease subunit